MDSTKLDRRIRLERLTVTQDAGSGENIEVWAPLATVWASKRDVSDGERRAAAEVQAELSTRFQIRYSIEVADLNAKDRLICEGKTYAIVGTKELGRHDGIEITAAVRND